MQAAVGCGVEGQVVSMGSLREAIAALKALGPPPRLSPSSQKPEKKLGRGVAGMGGDVSAEKGKEEEGELRSAAEACLELAVQAASSNSKLADLHAAQQVCRVLTYADVCGSDTYADVC